MYSYMHFWKERSPPLLPETAMLAYSITARVLLQTEAFLCWPEDHDTWGQEQGRRAN